MATPTLSATPKKRNTTKRVLWITASVLLVIAVALGTGVAWFHHAAVASLPQLDGEIKLKGLTGPVTVIRDQHGVPHITASSMEDLLFAQGFVTAQDRLWQMDLNRRYGRGELSEILGSRTLKLDEQQRTIRLAWAAEQAVKALSPRDEKHLQAYVDGVNALMKMQADRLPIEFRVLGYKPRPWTMQDSIVTGVNISQTLNSQWETEYSHDLIASRLGAELTADLYPNSSWRDRPPSALPRTEQYPPAPVAIESSAKRVEHEAFEILRELAGGPAETQCDSCTPGSNNWVVSGSHTVSGKPLLSNDMHLMHTIPNFWYEAHLQAGDYDVTGVTIPGLPLVLAGHNRRIAWGFTNVGPDVQDLFVEDGHGGGEYRTPDGWQKASHIQEIIHVKGAADVVLDVVVTRHGPLVSRLFPRESRDIALKWTLYDPTCLTMPFYDVGLANNWQEFREAFSKFGGPSQNVVYADVDGHIGYQTTGKIPVRASGDGLSLVQGNDDAHEWTGYIPFDQLPSVYDPAEGIIATANGRITPDGYTHLISTQWGSPYRTERIYRVLESGKKFAAADMLALQLDTYSEFDRLFANQLVYAVDHFKESSPRAKEAADIMRHWDGRVEVDAVAPTIAVRARRKLWLLLLEPRLGDLWEEYSWFNSSVAMERLLQSKPQRWLPADIQDYNQLLTEALELAVSDGSTPTNSQTGNGISRAMADKNPSTSTEKPAPRNLKELTWGKNFPIDLNHPVFGGIPILRNYSGPGWHPQSGNGSLTVKAAGRSFGASERATYDMSDLDSSTLNIVAGESGQLFSPYYLDHWPYWYGGKTFALPFSDEAVKRSAAHTLMLRPAQ
jgi:penicillin amidase